MRKIPLLVLFASLTFTTQAAAQSNAYSDLWGVNIGLTPSWHAMEGMRFLFDADRIDLQGSEVRFGFVRGRLLDSDWGISFVRKAITENSAVDVDVVACGRGECGTFYRTLQQTRMTGLEFHRFQPLVTWRDRIQLGTMGAIGVAWLQGQVYKRTTTDGSDVESFDASAGELFPPRDQNVPVPLLKLELAVAGIVAPGFKVRASGGFSVPGYQTFSVTFLYLIPQR